jgi:DNA invertase Pin-like site-specific DNA recombinase
MTQKFIAYYRVSTDRQGQSGLGLEAQRSAVIHHIAGNGELVAEFTEIESGKKNDRPQLAAALSACRKQKARLLIAKLDRLARNVAFVANLMESGVEFVAVDNPHANKLMLHMLAAFAEHEREQISKRTKEALAAAKQRGTRLGNPRPNASLARGRATIEEHVAQRLARVQPLILALREQGLTTRAIAQELNERRIPTARGKQWYSATVCNVLKAGE